MRSWIVAVIAVSAAGADASPTRLVVADGASATLVEADATAKIVATVKLPSSVQRIVWIGRDPIALLEHGVVGAITAKGFVAMATPPSSTFVLPRPSDGVDKLDTPEWGLVGSTAGELWLGRCDWGFHPDGGTVCDSWVWARLGGPTLLSRVAPTDGAPGWEGWPSSIQPPPNISVTFAKRAHRDDDDVPDSAESMTCRYAGTTSTFPTDANYWTEHGTLRWISRDPPIFVVDALANGFAGIEVPTVFEGCDESTQFRESSQSPPPMEIGPSRSGVAGYMGPANLFVLATGQRSSLRRDGKELLALPGSSFVAFAPDRSMPAASDGFALLAREIAGDASMFASDAIVLSPTPAVGAPKLAKHRTVRIERFATDQVGDSSWFAAELQLDGKLFRTLQLIDASGHVVVATFAPVKSLASGGIAPAIPSPTTGPTPLADFAASPTQASKAAYNGTAVFGTEPGEHAVGGAEYAPSLLAGWGKLALARDPAVREVHAAGYGYAIATVTLAKSRMIVLVIGAPKAGGWKLEAVHYLGL